MYSLLELSLLNEFPKFITTVLYHIYELGIIKILSGYPFRMTQADKLREAVSLIEDFMYDEAADIIRQIVPTIE